MRQVSILFIALFLPLLLVQAQTRPALAMIEGRVINAITGEPLSGVLVTSRLPATEGPASPSDRVRLDSFERPVIQTLTDADGRFSVNVMAGRASVVFGKDLYGVRTLTYSIDGGQRLQDAIVGLAPTSIISGRIVDSKNNPVASALVRPLRHRYTARGRELFGYPTVRTNDRGEFRLANLAPNAYLLLFSSLTGSAFYPAARELADAEYVSLEAGKETRLKDVVLETGSLKQGTIRVRITNSPGEGPKDVKVSLINATPNLDQPALDGNSIYHVQQSGSDAPVIHLEPSETSTSTHAVTSVGLYSARAEWRVADGIVSRSTVVYAAFSGADVNIDLIIKTPDGRLSCRVMLEEADGTLSPLVRVNVIMRSAASASANCFTGSDGSYVVPSIQTGKYELSGFQGIPPDAYIARVTVGAQDGLNNGFEVTTENSILDVRVRRGAGVAKGKVIDSQGRIVHDAVVIAVPDSAGGRSLASTLGFSTDRTDQNGGFEIRGLQPDTYRLYAWSVLEDDALGNPEFLKEFEGRGTEINVRERETASKDLVVVE